MDESERAPFIIPFLSALLFGIPASLVWHFVANQFGILAAAITIFLGCLCGLGARVAAGGHHPAGAAIIATLLLIVINISITTIQVIATEADLTFTSTLLMLFTQGNFSDFANDCAAVGGRTFVRYPVGLYAAYRLSDAS